MSGYTSTPGICGHCGYGHSGTCPRIKAIEYYANGTVKRVEYHEPQPSARSAGEGVDTPSHQL